MESDRYRNVKWGKIICNQNRKIGDTYYVILIAQIWFLNLQPRQQVGETMEKLPKKIDIYECADHGTVIIESLTPIFDTWFWKQKMHATYSYQPNMQNAT